MIKNIPLFQKQLLRWYQKNKRPLPWRQKKDPYSILVSEIMLQQTQVDTVIPYYKRWLKKFPTFETLAVAKEEAVLKLWQGLGYYRRAKMLHRNAQAVVRDHHGKLPQETKILIQLPGIGRYTAGAIASIAFDKKTPVLDGNVIRVLTRIFSISKNISEKKTIENLWEIATTLVPEKNAGDFNQAMMELGATVCKPQNPLCFTCPVSKMCRAFHLEKPESYPVKAPSAKITKLNEIAFILRNDQNHLLVKKQIKGERWEGLWALPHFEQIEQGLRLLGLKKTSLKMLRKDKHAFTRYQISLTTFALDHFHSMTPENFFWKTQKEISRLAFPAVHQKIVNEVFRK